MPEPGAVGATSGGDGSVEARGTSAAAAIDVKFSQFTAVQLHVAAPTGLGHPTRVQLAPMERGVTIATTAPSATACTSSKAPASSVLPGNTVNVSRGCIICTYAVPVQSGAS